MRTSAWRKAAFYPQVQLNGIAGFESVSAGTLFSWPSPFLVAGTVGDRAVV